MCLECNLGVQMAAALQEAPMGSSLNDFLISLQLFS